MGRFDNRSKRGGYNYAPVTPDNEYLKKHELGTSLQKTVRFVNRLYVADTGFGIYEVEDEQEHRFVVKGTFPVEPQLNGFYSVKGSVVEYKGKRNMALTEYHVTQPIERDAIIYTLKSLHGLDTRAHQLYDLFGPAILDTIKTEPEKVAKKVKGLGIKRVKEWQNQLSGLEKTDYTISTLRAYGIPLMAVKDLINKYGDSAVEKIQKNPYMLMHQVKGFGFQKCDTIALENNGLLDGEDRLLYAMKYALQDMSDHYGYTAVPSNEFWLSVLDVINPSIGFQAARSFLKQYQPGKTISYKVGSKEVTFSRDVLCQEFEAWQESKKKKPFSFPVCEVNEMRIRQVLKNAIDHGKIKKEIVGGETFYSLEKYYDAERAIVARINEIKGAANQLFPASKVKEIVSSVVQQEKIILEKKQMEAVLAISSCRGGIFILNGAAGCGKTFTLNLILKVLRVLYQQDSQIRGELHPKILAPTGKAAKVAAQATQLPASTIHKALGLVTSESPDAAEFSDTVIKENCVIIDECSMVDTMLASALFKAIKPTTKVILLGDTEQLPSIRAGNVFHDLIASQQIMTITLDVVRRQSSTSGVLKNANRIIEGSMIQTEKVSADSTDGNAYVANVPDPVKCRNIIVSQIQNAIASGRTVNDIQILCPQKLGDTGTDAMNYFIQKATNPYQSNTLRLMAATVKFHDGSGNSYSEPLYFQVGDKVIHVKNDYEAKWYSADPVRGLLQDTRVGIINGEMGQIKDITEWKDGSVTHRRILVAYDGGLVAYDDDFADLRHAYAMTIHKAQGSQWPVVIAPIVKANWIMLNRKLLYTMYTRAQNMSIVVGDFTAIRHAIRNTEITDRCTLLTQRLIPNLLEAC